jgi:AMMECR1 domain-containing protein
MSARGRKCCSTWHEPRSRRRCRHAPPSWPRDDAELAPHRAAFVTLRERDTGELRGCRGEIVATRSLAESVIEGATAAALDDPRFPPVGEAEIPGLLFEISVLSP